MNAADFRVGIWTTATTPFLLLSLLPPHSCLTFATGPTDSSRNEPSESSASATQLSTKTRGDLPLNEEAVRHGQFQPFHKALMIPEPHAVFPLRREQSTTAVGPAEISLGTLLLH